MDAASDLPESNILSWSVEDVNEFLHRLGLAQYEPQMLDNDINGEVLVHLDHEALKDLGIVSVGQRLAVLKAVYTLKLRDDVLFEKGHWIPPSDEIDDVPGDSAKMTGLLQQRGLLPFPQPLMSRDERIKSLELDVRRLGETLNAFRDEVHVISKTLYTKEPMPEAFRSRNSPTAQNFPYGLQQTPQYQSSGLQRSHSLQNPSSSNYFALSHGNSPADSPAVSPGAEALLPSFDSGHTLSETLADHAVLRSRGSSSSLYETGSNPPLTPGALLGQSPASPSVQKPPQPSSTTGLHSSTNSASRDDALKSSTSSGVSALDSANTSMTAPSSTTTVPPPPTAVTQNQPPPEQSTSSSASRSGADHPYKGFRVTLEDPCYKVLPAALKKYKINDNWRDYALFICYGHWGSGTSERCLSLDEKPLLLFSKLKDSNQKPVFMLRHIKDIESPISLAKQKHASRREKRAKDQDATLTGGTGDATLTGSGPASSKLAGSSSRTAKVFGQSDDSNAPVAEGNQVSIPSGATEKVGTPSSAGLNSGGGSLPSPAVAPVKGYCVSIYPYMAEREDEFDVSVGDTFVIVSKAKGWWVVYRQSAVTSVAAGADGEKQSRSGWVPAGCLLETTLSPSTLGSYPGATIIAAGQVPIKPSAIVSVSTPGIALMDFKPRGSDELALSRNEFVRVYKRHNHWSYAIKESTGERGWSPSWFLGKLSKKSDSGQKNQTETGDLHSPLDSAHVTSS